MNAYSGYRVENANCEKVLYYIDKMLSENDAYCRCNRCRMDAASVALNTLPPHYYVTPSHMNDKDMGSPWILIELAVREAMERVLLFPNHSHDGGPEAFPPADYPVQPEKTGTDG